jgi:hypothetical protein
MSYPRLFTTPGIGDFAEELDAERARQLAKWGDQRHPDGTGRPGDRDAADRMRAAGQANGPEQDNWRDILAEEVAEAFAEVDPGLLRAELVQVAAVCAAWIRDIGRRPAAGTSRFDGEPSADGS